MFKKALGIAASIAIALVAIVSSPRAALAGTLDGIIASLEADLAVLRGDVNDDFEDIIERATIRITALDAQGKSEARLTKEAKKYKKLLKSAANSTIPQLNRIEGDYIFRVLRENAGAGATAAVRDECDNYIDLVTIDLEEARIAIDEALAEQIED